MNPEWILASRSPQRKAILKKLGIPFRAVPSDVSEKTDRRMRPAALVCRIAEKKARRVAEKYPKQWVIGADTLVFLPNGKQACKPKNEKEAEKIIKSFNDSFCDVYSGVVLINREKQKCIRGNEKTRLFFRKISTLDIKTYLKTGEWKNRSGAMTMEGEGGQFVKEVVGDYWNVIGLPMLLFERLKKQAESA